MGHPRLTIRDRPQTNYRSQNSSTLCHAGLGSDRMHAIDAAILVVNSEYSAGLISELDAQKGQAVAYGSKNCSQFVQIKSSCFECAGRPAATSQENGSFSGAVVVTVFPSKSSTMISNTPLSNGKPGAACERRDSFDQPFSFQGQGAKVTVWIISRPAKQRVRRPCTTS